jgi:hypothetical protein
MVRVLVPQRGLALTAAVMVEQAAQPILAVLVAIIIAEYMFGLAVAVVVLVTELQGLSLEQAAYWAVVAVEAGLRQAQEAVLVGLALFLFPTFQ